MEDIANANDPEIEVTPAMIEAGEEVFGLYSRELDSRRETVVAILTAMIQASRVRPNTGV